MPQLAVRANPTLDVVAPVARSTFRIYTVANRRCSLVKRCLEFPIDHSSYAEFRRWQAAIDMRAAFAVAIGAKPSALTPAA